ncbi:MAG TPA: hypothetical protein VLY24_28495 [Bryobacteraceae bacterium]|nr:hypothetical protein [Bryobacteraceae bacterium]
MPPAIDQERQKVIAELTVQIDNLRSELSKKHPRDEHREALLRGTLQHLDDRERNFVQWLYHAGEVRPEALVHSGLNRQSVDAVVDKTRGINLILVDSEWIGPNQLIERVRHYRVNPQFAVALDSIVGLGDYNTATAS